MLFLKKKPVLFFNFLCINPSDYSRSRSVIFCVCSIEEERGRCLFGAKNPMLVLLFAQFLRICTRSCFENRTTSSMKSSWREKNHWPLFDPKMCYYRNGGYLLFPSRDSYFWPWFGCKQGTLSVASSNQNQFPALYGFNDVSTFRSYNSQRQGQKISRKTFFFQNWPWICSLIHL